MASLKACPSKLSFTCTQRVSLEPPLTGNIKNCDNVIETAFVHEPAYLDPLFFLFWALFATGGMRWLTLFSEQSGVGILKQDVLYI